MATIDIKLKTYEQLQFEIIKLNTDNYLKQQQLDKYKNVIDKIKEYCKEEIIDNREYRDVAYRDALNNILELLEEVE